MGGGWFISWLVGGSDDGLIGRSVGCSMGRLVVWSVCETGHWFLCQYVG